MIPSFMTEVLEEICTEFLERNWDEGMKSKVLVFEC